MSDDDPFGLRGLRVEYAAPGLDEDDVGTDPLPTLGRWMTEAVEAGVPEPNAMALATADDDGVPSVRIVLLKGLDADGAVFFTNRRSRKGRELAVRPRASLVMLWHPMQRQVRIEGPVTEVPDADSDAYFASRPRDARLGAVASPQSEVLSGRGELERRLDETAAAYGDDVPRPAHWGGYRVGLEVVELWQGGRARLHDRLRFTRDGEGWRRDRLAP